MAPTHRCPRRSTAPARPHPGTLTGQARYLHRRTGGMIGSLMHLVRAAAISAIQDGTEAITPDLLEDIQIDHSAQSASTPPMLSA